mmetsp:Transcript_6481/g.19686  ORF Transcript_6481/g.19686 Transcript_6481/m.19686 type:complete len:111 (-) Transcript_6481:826-1158(-)
MSTTAQVPSSAPTYLVSSPTYAPSAPASPDPSELGSDGLPFYVFTNMTRSATWHSPHSHVYLVGILAVGVGLLFAALGVGMCRIHLERSRLKPPTALEMRQADLNPMSVA